MRLQSYVLTFFFVASLSIGSAVLGTTITATQFVTDPETIVSSKDGIFRLGFFSLGDSRNRYVGVWYNNIPGPTIVWVANRDHPLNDSSGVLRIASDGNIVVLDGQGKLCWTSNVTTVLVSHQLVAELLDTGNLVLRESSPNYNHNEGRYIWQSFDHPTNTLLPKMQFGVNLRTGKKQTITSWKNNSDPSTGDFTLELDPYVIPQLILKYGAQKKWRSGPWVEEFIGMDHPDSDFKLEKDYSKGTVFLSILYEDKSALSRIVLESDGKLTGKQWHEEKKQWLISWSSDIYNKCGPFGIYKQYSKTCSCMRGFEPKFTNEWKDGNWSGGCSRRKALQCEMFSSERSKVKEADGFLEVDMWNVPDYYHLSQGISYVQCHDKCLHDCSCIAYSYSNYDPNFGCMWWTRDLIDARETSEQLGFNLHIRVANSELDKEWDVKIILRTSVVIGIVLTSVSSYFCWIFTRKQVRSCLRWIGDQSGFIYLYFLYLIGKMKRGMRKSVEWERKRRYRTRKKKRIERSFVHSDEDYSYGREHSDSEMLIEENTEVRVIDFKTLAVATNNFSEANKLGQGGFGSVYKGMLRDGQEEQEIAVKRLSMNSEQGSQEFKNEVSVISKLQHRNLVRLLGCCTYGEEKMLIYEYMPNKSLDAFLFDPKMRGLFDWKRRFEIILGIDFGMARIFGSSELLQANTRKVAGTFGYMSPEYVIEGRLSEKSDVFSFGVLLLEIVSGKKNSSLCNQELSLRLLAHAWQLWNENNALALVDPTLVLSETSFEVEILRCIHVGLLCVEEFAVDRPTMATTLSMLTSEIATLPAPKNPAFTERRFSSDSSSSRKISNNDISITILGGR
ncbi:G-type lectin S-receptor-like serine/threonine-protein kinase At1g11300 isoform X3 [Papaver somniferum]|uniref:G-type lectin S-receptor-like serine/threonine-protein kinase At1g11300 isoform X3 n=1 Tax=Papaver somniferum TaxID=3469 RepID=UPI000E6FF6AF|nr:G-type lectin S-receptor-like serine/threonine-protein kinase At1g11300 isoform X3 [Papaver somniferum]